MNYYSFLLISKQNCATLKFIERQTPFRESSKFLKSFHITFPRDTSIIYKNLSKTYVLEHNIFVGILNFFRIR